MKFNDAIAVLRLLGTRPEDAITVQQIIAKWDAVHTDRLQLRTAQRYLSELSTEGADGAALVHVDASRRERRYYLHLSEMAHLFLTEEAALYQVLALQVLQSSFGSAARDSLQHQLAAADHISQLRTHTRRLRERVRIVPDGIGRLSAQVSPHVLVQIMDALAENKRLDIEYCPPQGVQAQRDVSPLGLVAKDGTLYLIAVKGLSDHPRHYALHRIQSAAVRPYMAEVRPNFDLDRYIHESHQLSHILGADTEPVLLRLKVAQQTMFHFQERPLCVDQRIEPCGEDSGWSIVTAQIPITILLKPFLLSLGSGVEVLEPASLRHTMQAWIAETARLYNETQPHNVSF